MFYYKDTLTFLTSSSKSKFLNNSLGDTILSYKINIIQKGKTIEDDTILFNELLSNKPKGFTLGIIKREYGRHLGKFAGMITEELKNIKTENVELLLKDIMSVKDEFEIKDISKCVQFLYEFHKIALEKIEDAIEEENENIIKSHKQLSDMLNNIIIDDDKQFESVINKIKNKNIDINKELVDIGYSPVIQSGGNYDIKITSISDNNKVKRDLIRLAMC